MNQKSVLQARSSGIVGRLDRLQPCAWRHVRSRSLKCTDKAQSATKKKKADKPKSAKVKFMPGSEETRAERRARLKIECKGAVNAGVCTGYTR